MASWTELLQTIGLTVGALALFTLFLVKSHRFRNVCIPLIVIVAGTVWYLYRKALERVCPGRQTVRKEPRQEVASATATSTENGSASAAAKLPAQRQPVRVKVKWMEDKDAPNCLHCHVKFTLLVRRHQ
jgi:hypothetical protein